MMTAIVTTKVRMTVTDMTADTVIAVDGSSSLIFIFTSVVFNVSNSVNKCVALHGRNMHNNHYDKVYTCIII